MGIFRRKKERKGNLSEYIKDDLPGFRTDNNGNLVFDITSAEQLEIDSTFSTCEGYLFTEEMQNALIAYSLYNYAEDRVGLAEGLSDKTGNRQKLNEAISAIIKAHTIHELPVYLYYIAKYSDLLGDQQGAKSMYKIFLNDHLHFKPSGSDKIILDNFFLDVMVTNAKKSL